MPCLHTPAHENCSTILVVQIGGSIDSAAFEELAKTSVVMQSLFEISWKIFVLAVCLLGRLCAP